MHCGSVLVGTQPATRAVFSQQPERQPVIPGSQRCIYRISGNWNLYGNDTWFGGQERTVARTTIRLIFPLYVLPRKRIKTAAAISLNDILEKRRPANTSAI